MLARGLLGRLSAHVPKTSTHDLSNATYAALIAQSGLSKQFYSTAHNVLKLYSPALARSYATAVKTRAKPKTTTKAKAKAAPKKRVTKKAPAKKKAPVKAKAKKTKKAVPARRRRTLTVKQKETAEKSKEIRRIKELRATALKEPKQKPSTAWLLITMEASEGAGVNATKNAGAAKERYHNLSAAEREHYNQIANSNKADNAAAYKKWVESHTPDQIRLANNARKLLATIAKTPGHNVKASYRAIRDERQVKLPTQPHIAFYSERYASGDFSGIAVSEAVKLASSEWKALPASEKKKYQDLYAKDKERYFTEHKRVYGHEARSASSSPAPA